MKKTKNTNRGITLIALIITIIMLLILAGVALASLFGDNGILNNAETAKNQTNLANSKEQVQLAVTSAMTYKDSLGTVKKANLVKELDKLLGAGEENYTITPDNEEGPWEVTVTKTGYKKTISSTGKIEESSNGGGSGTSNLTETEKSALITNGIAELTAEEIATLPNAEYLTDNENVKAVLTGGVVIPAEFTYVEGTKDTGVVVSVVGNNNVTSEFVWVPVETPVASIEADGTTNKAMAINLGTADAPQYRGLLYNFTGTTTVTSAVKSGCSTATYGSREPSLGGANDYVCNNTLGYDSTEEFEKVMQEDYDSMIKSVIKYGGFYIGRYETSANGETIASTKGTETTRPITDVSWYELYMKQKAFSTTNLLSAVESSMVWGSQYDAMMNWAIKGNDAGHVTSQGCAPHYIDDYTKAAYQPGTVTNDKINNIYDLEGNVYEYTLEAGNLTYHAGEYDSRTLRGGAHSVTAYNYVYSPCSRYDDYYFGLANGSADWRCGSRATLYIL